MTRELAPIDISTMPDLARLAEEVARTGMPRVLRQDDTDIAVLSPAPARRRRGRTVTPADIAASLAAIGSWKDLIDSDQLKRDLDAARGDDRAPLAL
jgi:hypothetical protein